jgi:hypothetical protein
MRKKEIWSRNNPLFMYGNEEKLNDLIGRVYGEVVTGMEDATRERENSM